MRDALSVGPITLRQSPQQGAGEMHDEVQTPSSDRAFARVARKIGDARLAGVLAGLAEHQIRIEVHNDKFRRKEGYSLKAIRRRIQKLKEKAEQCEKALSHISGVPLLYFPTHEGGRLKALRKALHDIIATCKTALAINPGTGGRPSLPDKSSCALIIVEAWATVHGKPPGHNNEKAWDACDEYWRACGYKTGSNWSRLITSAKKTQSNKRRRISEDIRRTMGAE